jgi:outer membrane receptor protein involved in Fe transport
MAASWLEAEFDEFEVPGFEDQEDQQVPNSPEWKFAAGVIYESERGFFSSLDLTLRPGTSGSVSVATVENDSRQILNGRVGWRFSSNLELSLWARNLLDEEYLDSYHPDSPGA